MLEKGLDVARVVHFRPARRQRRRDRLAVADKGHGPASGYAADRQGEPLGRQPIVLQLEIDR